MAAKTNENAGKGEEAESAKAAAVSKTSKVGRRLKQADFQVSQALPQWSSRPVSAGARTIGAAAGTSSMLRGRPSSGRTNGSKENRTRRRSKSGRRSQSGRRPSSAGAGQKTKQRERENIDPSTSDETAGILQAAIDNFTNGTTLKALKKQLQESERKADMHSEFIRKVRETWITPEMVEASRT